MASSDTVVGIVGVVLLAGIMAAVFVYEQNNPPEDAPPVSQVDERMAWFNKTYGVRLDPMGDIDGDGLANWEDLDMDNDGVADDNQTGNLRVAMPFSGSMRGVSPPNTQSLAEHPFVLAQGEQRLDLRLAYNVSVALPAGAPRIPSMTVQVLHGSEMVFTSTSDHATQTGTAVVISASIHEPLALGNYTFRIVANPAAPQPTPYEALLVADYGEVRPGPAEPLSPR